jgi:hypothetical protein
VDKMGIGSKLCIAAMLIGVGYYVAKHERPVKELFNGLYHKTTNVVEQPAREFYNWATDKNVSTNYSGLETNVQANLSSTSTTSQSSRVP